MRPLEELVALVAVEPRSPKAEDRDRALLSAALGLPAFTARDLCSVASCSSWASAARHVLRVLHREGLVEIVSPDGTKPYVYAWVGSPVADLATLRAAYQFDPTVEAAPYVTALEAEVDRLRAAVGEHPLVPHREAVPA